MTRLERINERLNTLYDAEKKVLNAEEYSISDRRLRRASLDQIQSAIRELERERDRVEKGGIQVKRVIYREG